MVHGLTVERELAALRAEHEALLGSFARLRQLMRELEAENARNVEIIRELCAHRLAVAYRAACKP